MRCPRMYQADHPKVYDDIRRRLAIRFCPRRKQRRPTDRRGPRVNKNGDKYDDSPITGAQQPEFLILIGDGTHVSTHHFKIRVPAGVIDCHLERAQLEVGNRVE